MRALLIGPAWVGDMVMAEPLSASLADRFDAVDVLAPASTAGVAARMPRVAQVRVMPVQRGEWAFSARRRLGRSLRGVYELAVVLPNSWKSALVPWFAGIPQRRGWRGEQRFGLLNQHVPLNGEQLPRMVDRFQTLASETFTPVAAAPPTLSGDVERGRARLADAGLSLDELAVALCPGAEFGPAKRWPADHFSELARALTSEGVRPVLLGGPGDRAVSDQIALEASGTLNLAGSTTLEEAVDVLAACAAAVTNDSGLMHVAAALQIPLVAVFGSSSAQFTPPLSDVATVMEQALACRPCFQRECPLGGDQNLQCLRGISVHDVFAATQRALSCAS